MLHTPDETLAARQLTRTTADGYYIADACLVHLRGNARPYFSLTGEHWTSAAAHKLGMDRDCEQSGAMGDTLADVFTDVPEVRLLAALHGCDDAGAPNVANAWYFFTGAPRVGAFDPVPGTDADAAVTTARYLRCGVNDLPAWVPDCSGFDPDERAALLAEHRATFAAFVDTLRAGWAADAARARAWLDGPDDDEPDTGDAGPLADVRLTVTEGPERGYDPDGWEHNSYRLRLTYQGRSMSVTYRMGIGNDAPPTIGDVLGNLVSDAATYDNSRHDFEDWAGEYGYDDTAEARGIFRAVARQSASLARLLGDDYMQAVHP